MNNPLFVMVANIMNQMGIPEVKIPKTISEEYTLKIWAVFEGKLPEVTTFKPALQQGILTILNDDEMRLTINNILTEYNDEIERRTTQILIRN